MPRTKREKTSGVVDKSVRLKAEGIGFLLSRAHQGFRLRMSAAIEGSGLHLGQIAILGVLAQTNNLSQKQLTRLTGIEKSSMVIFIDGLEAGGLVERLRHPTDRRAHVVHLADRALAKLAPIGLRLQEAEARNLSVLSADERETFAQLLSRVADHVCGHPGS
jgi:DNA-binding MarR family transcriptional regulator